MDNYGIIDWIIPVALIVGGGLTAAFMYCFVVSPLRTENQELQEHTGKLCRELLNANGRLTDKTMDPDYTREQRIQRFNDEVSRRNVDRKNRRDLLGREEKERDEIEVEDYSSDSSFPDPEGDPTQDSTVGTSGDVKLDIIQVHSPFEPITWEGLAVVCGGLSLLAFLCFFLRWLWLRRRLPISFFTQKKEVPPAGSKAAAVGMGYLIRYLKSSVARNLALAKELFGYVIPGFALTEAIAPFASAMACSILFVS